MPASKPRRPPRHYPAAPAPDAPPPPTPGDTGRYYRCPACDTAIAVSDVTCPTCGARLDWGTTAMRRAMLGYRPRHPAVLWLQILVGAVAALALLWILPFLWVLLTGATP